MANVCNYKMLISGAKRNCYAFIHSCNKYDAWIVDEEGTNKNYKIWYDGDCKWSVDSYTQVGDFDISEMPENIDEIEDWCNENRLYEFCMQSRSKIFNVEVWCCTMIECGLYDEDYERYHYKNGEEKSTRRMPSELIFERPNRYETVIKYIISDLKGTTGEMKEFPEFDNEEEAEAYTNKLNEEEPRRYAYYKKEEQIDTW